MNVNANAFRRSCRTRMTMKAVEKFRNRESFYLPWSFDYRGRAYPIPAFLTLISEIVLLANRFTSAAAGDELTPVIVTVGVAA